MHVIWLTPIIPQIGINLGDPIFRGVYHGKQAHEDDFEGVLERARAAGCEKMMVTGSDLKESEHAVQIAKEHCKFPPSLFSFSSSLSFLLSFHLYHFRTPA